VEYRARSLQMTEQLQVNGSALLVADGYKTLGNVAVVPQSLFPSLTISRLVLEAVAQESIHLPGGSSYGFRQGWQRVTSLDLVRI